MTSKAFWALRAAGKYEEARTFLLEQLTSKCPNNGEELYLLGRVAEEGLLGFSEDLPWADYLILGASDRGHEASVILCIPHDRPELLPPFSTLTCAYARALWYQFMARFHESDYYKELETESMKEAAAAGNIHAMRKCGPEWIKRGAALGDLACLAMEVETSSDFGHVFECVKMAAFQGSINACTQMINAFTRNLPAHLGDISRTWHIDWVLNCLN